MNKNKIISKFSNIKEYENDDTRFLKVTIDILHTGLNFNSSIFNKDVVEKAIPSIYNIPILGYINKDDVPDFEGHEYVTVITPDSYEEKYYGRAFGVIPESCNPRWIVKECEDGEQREFLQVDGLLWNKFSEATDIFYRDLTKSQSMELEIESMDGVEDENEIYTFTNFKFEGACILGDKLEPAMINSTITANFSKDDFVNNVVADIKNKLQEFSLIESSETNQGGTDMEIENNNTANTEVVVDNDLENVVIPETTVKEEKEISNDSPVVNEEQPKEEAEEIEVETKVESENPLTEEALESIQNQLIEIQKTNTQLTEKNSTLEKELLETKSKLDIYVKAEQDAFAKEEESKKDILFGRFDEQFKDVESYNSLKEKRNEFTSEEVEKELGLILIRENLGVKFSKKSNDELDGALGVIDPQRERGDFYPKYGKIIRKNRSY